MGLRFRVIALILLFFNPFFFFSLYNMLIFIVCVKVFSEIVEARILKHIYTWTMSCCIVGLRIRLIAHIILFIYPFFCLSRLNLCHSFLYKLESSNIQNSM